MTTINQLSLADTVTADDRVPIWREAADDTRALPVGVLADFVSNVAEEAIAADVAAAATSANAAASSEAAAATSATTATAQADIAATQAGIATTQATNSANSATAAAASASNALQAALTAQGFSNTLSAAASALPFEVTAISGGVGTGTGGTNGVYNLGVTGGPAGFKATVTISGGAIASYDIVNPGIATTNAVPTLSLSGVTGLTGATTPTATVGTIPVNRVFYAPDSTGTLKLAWINSAGALASYPVGGTQYSEYFKSGIDDVISSVTDLIQTLPIPDPGKSLVLGSIGGPEIASWDVLGLLDLPFGAKSLPIAADDGTVASTVIAYSDEISGVKYAIADAATRAVLFAIYTDGTAYLNLANTNSARPDLENVSRLRALRSGLTYLKNSGSALVHVILDGDSWFDSKVYGSTDAITRFFADSGLTNAGPGWIGFASPVSSSFGPHGTALNNIGVTRSGTWTDLFKSADVSVGTIQNFPGYDAAQSGANGSIYTITGSTIANCTSLTLFCGKGGTVEQSWDGTTYTAVSVTAGSGSTTATINMTDKTNTLRLRCANGTVVAGLFGLTASSGVVFSNLSNSGATAAQKATVQANADYIATMRALPGDTITALVQLGLNDTKAGTLNPAIVTSVAAVAAGYRAIYTGFPSCDIGILCQPNTSLSVQDTLAPLLRAWAYSNDAMFFDWQNSFGTPATSGDFASYSRDYTSGAASTAQPLLEVDTAYRHPSPAADLIAASKSPALNGASVIASGLSNILLSPLRSN